jgi:hypothetical protein
MMIPSIIMHRIKLLVRIYIVVVIAKDKGEYGAQMILYYSIQDLQKIKEMGVVDL